MPSQKQINDAHEAHWQATIKGSVHPNDWAAVKEHDTYAPDQPEPEHPIVEAVAAVAQAAKPTTQVKPAEAKTEAKADVKAEPHKE